MGKIKFIVHGEPKGKGRPRATARNGFVQMHTPTTTKEAEKEVASAAMAAMGSCKPFTGPLHVRMTIMHGLRKSWSKAKKEDALLGNIVPTIKSDIDNIIKLYFDALNGIVWTDDVQVVSVTAVKRFVSNGRVYIEVEEIKGKRP